MPFVGNQPFDRVRRTGAARGADGRPTAPTSVTTAGLLATINPVPGEQLALLPEGERRGENIRIIAPLGTLRGSDDNTGVLADLVIWQGKTYEVRTVQVYTRVIPHQEIRALRIEGG